MYYIMVIIQFGLLKNIRLIITRIGRNETIQRTNITAVTNFIRNDF